MTNAWHWSWGDPMAEFIWVRKISRPSLILPPGDGSTALDFGFLQDDVT